MLARLVPPGCIRRLPVGVKPVMICQQHDLPTLNPRESAMEKKAAYEAPKITVVGTIEELTQGNKAGGRLDATYPTDTPTENLTFS